VTALRLLQAILVLSVETSLAQFLVNTAAFVSVLTNAIALQAVVTSEINVTTSHVTLDVLEEESALHQTCASVSLAIAQM